MIKKLKLEVEFDIDFSPIVNKEFNDRDISYQIGRLMNTMFVNSLLATQQALINKLDSCKTQKEKESITINDIHPLFKLDERITQSIVNNYKLTIK